MAGHRLLQGVQHEIEVSLDLAAVPTKDAYLRGGRPTLTAAQVVLGGGGSPPGQSRACATIVVPSLTVSAGEPYSSYPRSRASLTR